MCGPGGEIGLLEVTIFSDSTVQAAEQDATPLIFSRFHTVYISRACGLLTFLYTYSVYCTRTRPSPSICMTTLPACLSPYPNYLLLFIYLALVTLFTDCFPVSTLRGAGHSFIIVDERCFANLQPELQTTQIVGGFVRHTRTPQLVPLTAVKMTSLWQIGTPPTSNILFWGSSLVVRQVGPSQASLCIACLWLCRLYLVDFW